MKRLVLAFSFLIIGHTAWSCSCFGQPTFCETIDTSWVEPDIIVLATKVSDVYYGMQLVVDQTFSGHTEAGDTLMVWGDNGALCRIYTAAWSVGTTAVFALHYTDFTGNWITNPQYPPNLEQQGDYHISVCGVYNLGFSNGMVTGPIAPGFSSMNLTDFAGLVDDCFITTGVNEFNLELDFSVWSDGELLLVELPADQGGKFEMTLLTIDGKQVHQAQLFGGRTSIPVVPLPAGTYLVRVTQNDRRTVKKVVTL